MSSRYEILKKFSEAYGPSSSEGEICEVIQDTLGRDFSFIETAHGNLIAWHGKSLLKKNSDNSNVLMLQAHMDELAFLPEKYLDDGFIKITPMSHVPSNVDNQPVLFKPGDKKGFLSVNLKTKPPEYFLDVGAGSAEEAEETVPYYAVGAYCSSFRESRSGITCKSLDDRAGCAIIAETMLEYAERDDSPVVVAVFSTREETGNWPVPEVVREITRLDLIPQLIINIEVCPGGPVHDQSQTIIKCGGGVGLVHMERHYKASSKICRYMADIAEENNILFQHVAMRSGGGELGRFAFGLGVRGYGLVIPGRYMHSPNSVIAKKDYESAFSMIKAVLDRGELP